MQVKIPIYKDNIKREAKHGICGKKLTSRVVKKGRNFRSGRQMNQFTRN